MRKIMLLLAVVGSTVGLVFSQTGFAGVVDGGGHSECRESKPAYKMTLSSAWNGVGSLWSDGMKDGKYDGKHKRGSEVENEADQSNGDLCQNAKNEPYATVLNENENKNPQFTLVGSNSEKNWQSNNTWIDQSQHANASQANVLWQGIWVADGPDGGRKHSHGSEIENDADQSNDRLNQNAENKPNALVGNENVNWNPQFTLVGSNYQYNKQSNNTWIDQSQQANASQANVAGQSIQVGNPIDPKNDADQSNGTLDQNAKNKPNAEVGNENVNFNPQFTLVGNNSQNNSQSNNTTIDQSQEANASQLNIAGQSISLGGL